MVEESIFQVRDHRNWVVGSTMTRKIAERAAKRLKGSFEAMPLSEILSVEALARFHAGELVWADSITPDGKVICTPHKPRDNSVSSR